jgi:hypothetical protein
MVDAGADMDAVIGNTAGGSPEYEPLGGGLRAVHAAAMCGHLDCLKLLHERFGCDMGAATGSGMTPAFLAAANCQLQCLKYLHDPCGVSTSVVPHSGHWSGKSAMEAAEKGPFGNNESGSPAAAPEAVVEFLASLGNARYTTVFEAAANDDGADSIRQLVGQGGHDPDSKHPEGHREFSGLPAVLIAAFHGHLACLEALKEVRADMNAVCDMPSTLQFGGGLRAVHAAAMCGQLDCLKLLHKRFGCDMGATTKTGVTPAFLAAANCQLQCL